MTSFGEAETQGFFYHLAQDDPSAPRIPKVHANFGADGDERYFHGAVDLVAVIAAPTVGLLLRQTFPTGAFGRISGGCAHRRFFQDTRAPLDFTDAKALTIYVNKALSRLPRRSQPPPIDLTSAPLAIYHSDISMGNFLLDPATQRVWLIDFEHVGAFPLAVRAFVLYNTGSAFAAAVGTLLGVEREHGETLTSMVHAANLLRMCGDEQMLTVDTLQDSMETGRCALD
ncbi:hypothetical protein B0H14DRAFT_3577920 [Mycena olivaceomarginata]|nr:hypothetical protein B0H14DRAFT_3577920 [Mycena olivaceomarginata]